MNTVGDHPIRGVFTVAEDRNAHRSGATPIAQSLFQSDCTVRKRLKRFLSLTLIESPICSGKHSRDQ